jgi:DNA-binding winged helix-turn-helix (wHTH) protein
MGATGDNTTLYGRELRLGGWWVRRGLNELVGSEEDAHLRAKSFTVLVSLAELAGEVRFKKRRVHSAWGESLVSDLVLIRAISLPRKARQEDPKAPGLRRDDSEPIWDHRRSYAARKEMS